MTKLVFLVEEPSMADLLEQLLPRLFPTLAFQTVPHKGKGHLERSIPSKLRAWQEPGVRFVVLRDQNSADCRQVKAILADLCRQGGRADTLVRVVCKELEAWYIGSEDMLARAFPEAGRRVTRELRRARFRDPDAVVRPAEVLADLLPRFRKRATALAMGQLLTRESRSRSYQVFLEGIERLLAEDASGDASPPS